ALAAAEGVVNDLVMRIAGGLPALCVVESDAKAKRQFHYWREEAPARDLFELSEWTRTVEGMMSTKLIYFSGITLSLYSNTGLGRFLAATELARRQGVKVVFDGNFRARNWRGDLSRARTVFMEAPKRGAIALPTYDGEAVLRA